MKTDHAERPASGHTVDALMFAAEGDAAAAVTAFAKCAQSERRDFAADLADALGWTVERLKRACSRVARGMSPEPPELVAVEVADFLAAEIKPRGLILDPVIPEAGLAMIYGPRGTGKTFVGIGCSVAAASGGEFLGWKAPKPCGALYLDGEMPQADLQVRFAQEVAAAEHAIQAPLRIVTPDLQTRGVPDISTAEGQDRVETLLDGIDLVVIDHLSALARTGIEAEGESWLPVQDWLLSLRSRRVSVLILHHAGKNGTQRGTSRREDVLDTVLALRRPKDYCPSEGARFEVHVEKGRTLHGEGARGFEAWLQTDADGRPTWTMRDVAVITAERVAELHRDGLKQREIADELGCSVGLVNKHLKRAKSQAQGGCSP